MTPTDRANQAIATYKTTHYTDDALIEIIKELVAEVRRQMIMVNAHPVAPAPLCCEDFENCELIDFCCDKAKERAEFRRVSACTKS